MLTREHSDFQWFRERTKSLHSPLLTKMATNSAPLNPEPADPQQRAQQHLPPKSYADAVQEDVENEPTRNGIVKSKVNGATAVQRPVAVKDGDYVNGENVDEDKIVYEKYRNGDGTVLTSIKPDPSYEESLKHGAKTAPRDQREDAKNTKKRQDTPKSQLATGRRAGAGWERSA